MAEPTEEMVNKAVDITDSDGPLVSAIAQALADSYEAGLVCGIKEAAGVTTALSLDYISGRILALLPGVTK